MGMFYYNLQVSMTFAVLLFFFLQYNNGDNAENFEWQ